MINGIISDFDISYLNQTGFSLEKGKNRVLSLKVPIKVRSPRGLSKAKVHESILRFVHQSLVLSSHLKLYRLELTVDNIVNHKVDPLVKSAALLNAHEGYKRSVHVFFS